jgi:hypothetical protein
MGAVLFTIIAVPSALKLLPPRRRGGFPDYIHRRHQVQQIPTVAMKIDAAGCFE